MVAELPSGKLEYGGASLGYLSFRQNVWTCCSLRASCPEYCRAGKCSVTQVVPREMECVASCPLFIRRLIPDSRFPFCHEETPRFLFCLRVLPNQLALPARGCPASPIVHRVGRGAGLFIMAASGSLVQRRRVGMASHRVVSIWIFAR